MPTTDGPYELGAWVADEGEQRRHTVELRRLAGRRIERIRYAEIRYEEPPLPHWPGPLFDSLDFGLELDLDNGETWSATWLQRSHHEGVWLFDAPLVAKAYVSEPDWIAWDLSERWRELGPTVITDMTSHWTRPFDGTAYFVESGEPVESTVRSDLCQTAVVLYSDGGGTTVLTPGDRMPDGRFGYSHENIAVFFSIADSVAAGVW